MMAILIHTTSVPPSTLIKSSADLVGYPDRGVN